MEDKKTPYVESGKPVVLELQEGYHFKIMFPDVIGTSLDMDEPEPVGNGSGPNASNVLAAAVANCLSASLIFCLKRSGIGVEEVRSEALPFIARNDKGYWRVKEISVSINVKVNNDADKSKIDRCISIFENYCVVTGAIREGIKVNINTKLA